MNYGAERFPDAGAALSHRG